MFFNKLLQLLNQSCNFEVLHDYKPPQNHNEVYFMIKVCNSNHFNMIRLNKINMMMIAKI